MLRRGVAEALDAGGARRARSRTARTLRAIDSAWKAAHVVRYIAQQRALSDIPDERRAVVEIYRMDNRQTAVFHTCAGRRVNETLARIVGARIARRHRVNAQLTTDDNGFLIALPARLQLPDTEWAACCSGPKFRRRSARRIARVVSVARAHFATSRTPGCLVLRRAGGRTLRRGAHGVECRAKIFDRLFSADRDFPLIRETIARRDARSARCAVGDARVSRRARRANRACVHPVAATPFTFGIVTSSFGDTVAVDDRASMIEALHERVLAVLGEPPRKPPEPRCRVPYDKYGQPMLPAMIPPVAASDERHPLAPRRHRIAGRLRVARSASRVLLCADAHFGYEDVMGGGTAALEHG